MVTDWSAQRDAFPIFRRAIYFNTCSLGALSTRVETAVSRFLALWHQHGASAWDGPWWGAVGGGGGERVTLASRDGLTMHRDDFAAATDRRTQLVVASHVYFTSGYLQDLAAIGEIAHAQGALWLVDAYQGT